MYISKRTYKIIVIILNVICAVSRCAKAFFFGWFDNLVNDGDDDDDAILWH